MPSLTPCIIGLVNKSAQVGQRALFGHPHNPSCYCLATAVVTYAVVLLFQSGLRDCCIFEHSFIVAKHIRRTLNRDPKHVQLIAWRLDVLNCRPHGNNLATECACLHGILPFTVPDNRNSVQEYENSSLRSSCHSV